MRTKWRKMLWAEASQVFAEDLRRDREKQAKKALRERMETVGYEVARLRCKTLEQQKRELI